MNRLQSRAREMRRQLTPAERHLWTWLRDRRFGEHKFRRQHPIEGYITDFYCAELKLVIEVDGKHHRSAEMQESESKRTEALERRGITIVRVPNEELRIHPASVEDQIRHAIAEIMRLRPLIRPSATFSPLSRGEGE